MNFRGIYMALICLILNPGMLSAKTGPAISAGTGACDVVFSYASQKNFLGYETGILTHNFPALCIQAGIFQHLALTEKLEGSVAMEFCRRGVNYSTSFLYDDLIYRLHIYYLRFPLLLKYHMGAEPGKLSGPVAGAYISATLGASLWMEGNGPGMRRSMDNVKGWDTGILLGYDWGIGTVPRRFLLNFRLAYSLIDVMEELDGTPEYESQPNSIARNASLEFGITCFL